jgi:1-acyl-sn-glycerol-3-phosphate acyltransferase
MSERALVGRLLVPVRALWWHLVWGSLVRLVCRRFVVTGLTNVPRAPVVFAANHASHADTVIMQFVFARTGRYRVLVAGASDYFFAGWMWSTFATFLGVFPFPRVGEAGVGRSRSALSAGWCVLLFPQGTRDGGPFRRGVARVARNAAAVVPVHISGTDRVLPKGRRVPVPSPVAVHFGAPLTVAPGESDEAFARRLEGAVYGSTQECAA